MIKNYFKIAWRNIVKNRLFSLVNIIGLSTGIAFTLLIGAYVWGELQVNRQLKNADRQYIIQSKWKDPKMGYEITTLAELPKALKTEYPNLVANYYHWDGISSNVSKGDKRFRESIQVGDSTLLNMYGFALLHGNIHTVFTHPFSVLITEEKAIKYFGKTNVVGEMITIESFLGSKHGFTISGVLKKSPENSILNLNDHDNMFLPISAAKFMGRKVDGWNNPSLVGNIELQPGITPKDLEIPIRNLLKKNTVIQIQQNLTPYLVPLKSYYLTANNGVVKKMLYTLSSIALFILLMAVINFINMCVSQSASRMKEMGIRKVLGGMKKQLVWQFLIESTLLVLLATVFALLIYTIARPIFNDVLAKEILGLFAFPAYFFLIPLFLALFIGLMAGVYPAFVLASLKSVDSLKGKVNSVKESVLMRKLLVAFQFGIAVIVFVGAIIISQQVKLFFSKNLGYDKDYVIYASVPRDWSRKGVQKMEQVREQLAQMPEISNISLSWEIPDGMNGSAMQVYKLSNDSTQAVITQALGTDNQFAATYGIPLKAGTFFTGFYAPGDSTKVVINETQSKALGWQDPKMAIGQQIHITGIKNVFTVCGVTADFHFGSMQQQIQPATFINVNFSNFYRYFSIKLKPGNMQQNLEAVQKKWATLLPDAPFEYKFVDDALRKLYQTEIQLQKASYLATALAIIIVLLGILGLIAQSIQKRTKEIGIRKVLGSSVAGIILLFLKDFLGTILLAGLVACPVAFFIMQKWLSDYVYRITITTNPFLIAMALLTLVTALLIALQTVKAALANPVKSLRSE
ncbi:MAG: ABC transporter permease [Mucilaginibacter sp.]|uniref:ABC transporter permease n=1 Tax=Mucilaginibacter sp. TaxID=1882438 RepID=UPI0034E43B68